MAKIFTAKEAKIESIVLIPGEVSRIIIRYLNTFQDSSGALISSKKEYNLDVETLPLKFAQEVKEIILYFQNKQNQELSL